MDVLISGERKVAALLFADLTGFTKLCQRLDPEDVAAVVRPLMTAMRQAAVAEGGVITLEAGDGFLAVFGVPTSYVDPAHRAVRAANAMRAIQIQQASAVPDVPVPTVHIGAASGEVFVSPSDDAIGWSLIGSPINLASRLCDVAGSGEVLLDETIAQMIGLAVDAAILLDLKSHDEPVRAFLLAPDLQLRDLSPAPREFIDREHILLDLNHALEESTSLRVGRVVRLRGVKGIGKTRLVEHWMSLHPEAAKATVWCAVESSDPALELIDELASLQTDGDSGAVRLLRDAMREGTEMPGLSADAAALFRATVRSLSEHATKAGRPTIVFLDDIHLAPPGLQALVEELEVNPLAASVLMITTASNDDLEGGAHGIDIDSLSPPDFARLLDMALEGATPAEVVAAIYERTGGHPLLGLQTVTHLLETGALTVAGGRCQLNGPMPEALPTSTRLFAASRIDRLSPDSKAALLALSTSGLRFQSSVLPLLFGRDVDSQLEDLVRRRMIEPDGRGWRFAHRALRDAAYAAQPRAARSALHQRQLAASGDDRALRCFHARAWAQATSPTDGSARLPALLNAISETRGHAAQLAVTDVRAAVALLNEVRSWSAEVSEHIPDECIRFQTLLAWCLLELGRRQEALEEIEAAAALVGATVAEELRLRVILTRGQVLSQLRRYPQARTDLNSVILAAAAERLPMTQGRALYLLAHTYRHEDSDRLTELMEEAYAVLMQAGDTQGAADAAQYLAFWASASYRARFDKWFSNAAALADDGDPRRLMWLDRARSYALNLRWDPGAIEAAESCRRTAAALGNWQAQLDGIVIGIEANLEHGELDQAALLLAELAEFVGESTDVRPRMLLFLERIQLLPRLGRSADGDKEIAAAEGFAASIGTPEMNSVAEAKLLVLMNRGEFDAAHAMLSRLSELGDEAGFDATGVAAGVHEMALAVAQERPTEITAEFADQLFLVGAPVIAGYAAALAEQSQLLQERTTTAELAASSPSAGLLELAVRADSFALLTAPDDSSAWQAAADAWLPLGFSIWLARAQWRSGDHPSAEATLAGLGAGDDQRMFCESWGRRATSG